MATKKTTNMDNIESADMEIVNESKQPVKKAVAKKFDPSETIPCRSLTYG